VVTRHHREFVQACRTFLFGKNLPMHLPYLLISAPCDLLTASRLHQNCISAYGRTKLLMQLLVFPFLLFFCTIDRPNPLPSTRFSSLPSICNTSFTVSGIVSVRPPQIKSRKRRREESPLPGIFEGMEYGVDGSTRTSAGSRLRFASLSS